MASIHQIHRSPFWYCSFYLPDGRRAFRSSGTTDKRKAREICMEWDKASRLGREGRLTEVRARETISDIYAIANQERLPCESVEGYLEAWLSTKEAEVADSTLPAYKKAVDGLLDSLGSKKSKPMDSVTVRDIVALRGKEAKRVSATTVNKNLKILQIAWAQAVKDGIVQENVIKRVDGVKGSKVKRRPFTLPELKTLLTACDNEWRGMVLFGVYTGQRLGDLVCLTWRNVDLATGNVSLVTTKTKRSMVIPMAKALKNYVTGMPSSDDPDAWLFPRLHSVFDAARGSGTLSRQFGELLIDAGLIQGRKSHKTHEQGRGARRVASALSFHCLRHTATSLLKNAGASDVVAREIIGHDSEAVSRVYTHIENDTLRDAVNLLPDVTLDGGNKE